jgi:hypothetical protein
MLAISRAYAAMATSQREVSQYAAALARLAALAADNADALESVAQLFARKAKSKAQQQHQQQ